MPNQDRQIPDSMPLWCGSVLACTSMLSFGEEVQGRLQTYEVLHRASNSFEDSQEVVIQEGEHVNFSLPSQAIDTCKRQTRPADRVPDI